MTVQQKSKNEPEKILSVKSVQRHLDNNPNSDLYATAMIMEISLEIMKSMEPWLDECEAFIKHLVRD